MRRRRRPHMKGGDNMNKNSMNNRLHAAMAKATLSSAHAGAGLMSRWFYYQPRVPKRIAK